MNWVDIVILLVLGLSGLFGLWRGFVHEVLSLATWVVALLVAWFQAPALMPLLEGLLASEMARYVLAFSLLCFVVLMLGALLTHLIGRFVRKAGFRLPDRLLGVLFGLARGVLMVALLVFVGMNFFSTEPWWQASVLLPYATDLIEWSRLFLMEHGGQGATTV